MTPSQKAVRVKLTQCFILNIQYMHLKVHTHMSLHTAQTNTGLCGVVCIIVTIIIHDFHQFGVYDHIENPFQSEDERQQPSIYTVKVCTSFYSISDWSSGVCINN